MPSLRKSDIGKTIMVSISETLERKSERTVRDVINIEGGRWVNRMQRTSFSNHKNLMGQADHSEMLLPKNRLIGWDLQSFQVTGLVQSSLNMDLEKHNLDPARVTGHNSDSFLLDSGKFVAAIWIIWKARCRRNFQNDHMPLMQVARWIMNFSREIRDAIKNHPMRYVPSEKWVAWLPPAQNNIKLNTDGSVLQHKGHAAAGGILRNTKGEWIAGFFINVGICSVFEAKLWSVREGLSLTSKKGLSSIELDIDSSAAVALLRDRYNDNHPLCNKCADLLAFMGYSDSLGLCKLSNPPPPLCASLRNDVQGIRMLRSKCKAHPASSKGLGLGPGRNQGVLMWDWEVKAEKREWYGRDGRVAERWVESFAAGTLDRLDVEQCLD
ncbi:Ribonuclease H domain [Dillenia turbinata]|uniref:Ribonuclease H domain n=1 Tax=Dillenia turbinata TaxID=194707 RepID=A0AAN8WCW4_9MAGN